MPPTTKHKKTLSLSLKKARKTKKYKATIATWQEPREPEELVDLLNWMHEMGLEVQAAKERSCVDGYERYDVKEYRKHFSDVWLL